MLAHIIEELLVVIMPCMHVSSKFYHVLAMDLSALISTQICLIVSSPVADSGDTLVNVGLRGMPLDPCDPNSICSFFGNCFKEVLPKIPITDEPPTPGHFDALAEISFITFLE